MSGSEISGPRSGYGWRFIDLAGLGVNTARSYVAALLGIALYPLAAAVLLGLVVGFWGVFRGGGPAADPVIALLGQYGLIIVAGAAVLHGVVRFHHRPWRSLVASDLRLDSCRLAVGLAAELAILAAQLALVHAVTGWPWGFSLAVGPPVLVLSLLLIPLQAASEEILFRGYLTQALGRILGSRFAIAALVGVVFGVLHLNAYGPLTLPYFLVVSLSFSLASLRDERLELAIGGHAAMNLFAFAVANTGLLRPALLGGPTAGLEFNWAAVLVLAVNGVLFFAITRLLVRLFCRPGRRP